MDVPQLVWWLTVAGIVGLLLFDFMAPVRKAHAPSLREAALWSTTYVGIAIVFGAGVFVSADRRRARSTSRAQNVIAAARRHAIEYVDIEPDPSRCSEVYAALLAEEATLKQLPEKYRARIREEEKLMALLKRAHAEHARRSHEAAEYALRHGET